MFIDLLRCSPRERLVVSVAICLVKTVVSNELPLSTSCSNQQFQGDDELREQRKPLLQHLRCFLRPDPKLPHSWWFSDQRGPQIDARGIQASTLGGKIMLLMRTLTMDVIVTELVELFKQKSRGFEDSSDIYMHLSFRFCTASN